MDHTLVNPNPMRHHHIDLQDNPCIKNPMCITCPEEYVTIPLYMSGTIFCAGTLSSIQHQLEDCPLIVLTSPHDWYPHSVRFATVPHSEEEEYLFASIETIRVDALRSYVHETDIYPGLRNTVHNPSLVATRLVPQVRISDAKVPDATIITNLDEDVFEGRRQNVTYHRKFTSKERHLGVNPCDIIKRWHIGLGATTMKMKATTQRMLRFSIMPI